MKNIIEQGILAIIPTYIVGNGNCTVIQTKNGQVVLDKVIRTVIRNLCNYYHIDLQASNRYYKSLIPTKLSVPLPFSRNDIFFQVKVRRSIGKDDGSMGYFHLDGVSKIKSEDNRAIIVLNNGAEVPCLCTPENVRNHIKNGELVRDLYEKRHPSVGEQMEKYLASDSPATKADIGRLFMAIQDLKVR